MQMRISLIPALGLNGVALPGVYHLCQDRAGRRQSSDTTNSGSYNSSTGKVTTIETPSTLYIIYIIYTLHYNAIYTEEGSKKTKSAS